MANFKVEKGVPLKVARRSDTYPLSKMEIGDSFFIPAQEEIDTNSVRSTVCQWGRRNGNRVFSVRKQIGGVRVWRIK